MIYVGTVGEGVWRSQDGGETFSRISAGMFVELDVRTLAVPPQHPHTLYAGTNAGLYRTDNGGDRWERLDGPFDPGKGWPGGVMIWSLLIHPKRPETLFVGTCPSALYRSEDGGKNWERLEADLSPECGGILYPRVTCILADPSDDEGIWAGIEIDGVRRSADGGNTWEKLGKGLSSADIHGLAILPGTPKTVLASTNNDLNLSTDEGRTWQPQNVKAQFPWAYCRGIVQKVDDPNTLFLGNGNGPPGSEGALQISRDGGRTWQAASLPVPPNSTVWTFAANPATPDTLLCATVSGQVYLSRDGGKDWSKLAREFGEIRSLALTGD